MSIKEIAQQIIKEANEFMNENYGHENFSLYIGQSNIDINITGLRFNFKRWNGNAENHHCYTFTPQSYMYQIEVKQSIINDGMTFVRRYMDEYCKYKKTEGYLIFQYPARNINLSLVSTLDSLEFSKDEKHSTSIMFSDSNNPLDLIAGKIDSDLVKFIHHATQAYNQVLLALEEQPLCYLEYGEATNLLSRRYIPLQFHGEKIFLELDKKEEEVKITVKNTNETYNFKFPFIKENLLNVLNEVEQKNKMKNLLVPSSNFFSTFIQRDLQPHRVSQENISEEFDSLITYFDDWRKVEIFFKELAEQIENVDNKLSCFMKFKDEKGYYQNGMECSHINHDGYTLFFIKFYEISSNVNSRQIFKVFISTDANPPKEFNEYLMRCFKQTIEAKMKDLQI